MGVAQVVDDMGNPLVIPGDSHIQLFISTRLSLSPRVPRVRLKALQCQPKR